MSPRSPWQRYLAWRRAKRERYSEVSLWEEHREPAMGLYAGLAPALGAGERRVFASVGSLTRGWWDMRRTIGSLWLTDRRLVFVAPWWIRLPFGRPRLELDRREIASLRMRSVARSLFCPLSLILRAFEVETRDGKRYIFQAHKAQWWLDELRSSIDDGADV